MMLQLKWQSDPASAAPLGQECLGMHACAVQHMHAGSQACWFMWCSASIRFMIIHMSP